MQGCHLVESYKSAGCGPVRSPETVPKKRTGEQESKPKTTQQTQEKTHNKHKWDRSQQWELHV